MVPPSWVVVKIGTKGTNGNISTTSKYIAYDNKKTFLNISVVLKDLKN